MASDTMKVAALGRPFTLGMLYDARKDQLIPGLTLWDDKTLKENTVESSQHSSAFEISASDSIKSKASLLGVEGSLKVSYMCGLIEGGGSAKYLNDKKKFKNQSRVTCQYKATTNFKQLSMIDHLPRNTQQIDVIQKTSATHVVTGILYGANAFFVFDSEKLDTSRVTDFQGKMEVVIKKIPKLNVEGKVELKLTDEEKALTEKFSCKFYGDFILDSNPATFVEAVKTYIQLPKQLGKKGENSVPLKVSLMPLKKFYSEAVEPVREISVGLVSKIEYSLEDLSQIGMRCNDSLDNRSVENFPLIQEELCSFQKLCNDYATKLQKTIMKKLPLIRAGEEDESSAKQVFEDRDKSPFSHEKLSKWMEDKEREINIIRSCLERMEGTKIVRNKSELDREVLAAGVEDALCFVFTSMERGDTYLDVMADYLDSHKLGSTREGLWYNSEDVLTKMRKKNKDFHYLAKALKSNSRFCFLVAVIANKKYTGATIYHYKEGILVSEDFSKPVLPPVERITDRRDLIWYACDLTLDPNTVNGYLTLSLGNKKATCGDVWQTYPDHPERFDTHPQVMCRERLKGRHYWEIGWSNSSYESVYVGVAYKIIERKGNSSQSELGSNTMSWCFGQYGFLKSTLHAYHNGREWSDVFPSDCNRIGVFLDWPAGTLSYYTVSNKLSHLYTFHTKFTDPVYPCFSVGRSYNYVYLHPFK